MNLYNNLLNKNNKSPLFSLKIFHIKTMNFSFPQKCKTQVAKQIRMGRVGKFEHDYFIRVGWIIDSEICRSESEKCWSKSEFKFRSELDFFWSESEKRRSKSKKCRSKTIKMTEQIGTNSKRIGIFLTRIEEKSDRNKINEKWWNARTTNIPNSPLKKPNKIEEKQRKILQRKTHKKEIFWKMWNKDIIIFISTKAKVILTDTRIYISKIFMKVF